MSFVCRYLASPGRASPLSRPEAAALAAIGMGVVTIWETTAGAPGFRAPAGAAFFTADRGAHEGALAREAALAIGQPAQTPIYATVDYDTAAEDWPALDAYLEAFEAELARSGYLLGVYGELQVIDAAQRLTKWLWQTYAWSGGRRHPAAVLYQYHNGVTIAGTQTDLDRAFGDPGWWRPDGQPVEAIPAPPTEEGDGTVPLTKLGASGPHVAILQVLLGLAGQQLIPDGQFGPGTLAAVKAFQASAGLTADGIVGPMTWAALAQLRPQDVSALTAQLAAEKEKVERIRAIAG